MMPLPVTSLYAGLLGLVFVVLSIRVIAARRSARIFLGVGDDPRLERVVRAHANFAEYVPLVLVLMGLAEIEQAPPWLLHLIGASFLVGRISLAAALSLKPDDTRFRVPGMVSTFAALTVLPVFLLAVAWRHAAG